MFPEAKKLVSVSVTSMPVTGTRAEIVEATEAVETIKAVEATEVVGTAEIGEDGNESKDKCPNLARVLCIRYPITFRKNFVPVLALIDLGSEVNAIHPTFT